MPLKAPKLGSLQTQQGIDQWARHVPVEPDPDSTGSEQIQDLAVTEPKLAAGAVSTRATADKAITPAKMNDANALTVLGRPLATDGTRSDIALDTNGKFLVRRANQIVGDTIVDADIPAGIARDAEVDADISAAIATHEGAPDPHLQYLRTDDAADLYMPLTLTLTNAVDDAAAATAGVSVGRLYRNGSVVMIRVT
jgi:hypothetical protein